MQVLMYTTKQSPSNTSNGKGKEFGKRGGEQ